MDSFEEFPTPLRWLIGAVLLVVVSPGCGFDQPATGSPAAPTKGSTVGEEVLELEPVSFEEIEDLRLDAIGCWFVVAGEKTPQLFAGSGQAVIKVDGQLVVLHADPTTAVGGWGLATEFVGDSYRAGFSALSDPRRTSMESEEYEATLEVLSTAANTGLLMGLVTCGP